MSPQQRALSGLKRFHCGTNVESVFDEVPAVVPPSGPGVPFLRTAGVKCPRGDKESTEADQSWGHLNQKPERLADLSL